MAVPREPDQSLGGAVPKQHTIANPWRGRAWRRVMMGHTHLTEPEPAQDKGRVGDHDSSITGGDGTVMHVPQPAGIGWWASPDAVVIDPVWDTFFFQHLVPNVPCVFGPRLTAGWRVFGAAADGGWWVGSGDSDMSGDGGTTDALANLAALVSCAGGPERIVPVSHCAVDPRDAAARRAATDARLPCEMQLGDVVRHVKAMRATCARPCSDTGTDEPSKSNGSCHVAGTARDDCAINSVGAREADGVRRDCGDSCTARPETLIYLKDWHMLRDLPRGHTPPYDTPAIFRDDYLNEFSESVREDDYHFVYLGPRGTRTLLHTDVLASYSWTTSITGRKRWVFFEPRARHLLQDASGHFVEDLDAPVDPKRFPRFAEAAEFRIELVQLPGQTIFVPSGWPHQVENLDECLSVNANWVNACNLDCFVRAVAEDLAAAQREIADVRDIMGDEWNAACHKMVKSNCGFDLEAVCDMIATVYDRIATELDRLGRSSFCCKRRYKEFELVRMRDALKLAIDCWSKALDRGTAMPRKFVDLAAVLDRRCSKVLEWQAEEDAAWFSSGAVEMST